jgi:hypothetical protein
MYPDLRLWFVVHGWRAASKCVSCHCRDPAMQSRGRSRATYHLTPHKSHQTRRARQAFAFVIKDLVSFIGNFSRESVVDDSLHGIHFADRQEEVRKACRRHSARTGGETLVLPLLAQQSLFGIEGTLVLSRQSANQRHQYSLASEKLAQLSQLRTFFGFFALIFVVKPCVLIVTL